MEELKVGDIIKERYALVRFLGSGSFGEVWLALDQMTGRDVALKIYLSLDPAGVEEFQREYSNTFDLSSLYLLTPDYFDVYGRRPFLVMKFCENGSSTKLAGNISEDQIWKFISDVANGLSVLHGQSDPVVHQDIKPDNILIDGKGRFMITDFGISKRLRATMRRQSKRDVSSGAMPYMAPERFESTPKLTTASDIWSLGASIYELATGELPFSGFGGAMQRNGAELPSLPNTFSSALNEIMQRCLLSNSAERPSATELLSWAKNKTVPNSSSSHKTTHNSYPTVHETTTVTSSRQETSNSKWILILITIGVLIGGIFWWNNSHTDQISESESEITSPESVVKEIVNVPPNITAEQLVLNSSTTSINGQNVHFFKGAFYYENDIYPVMVGFITDGNRIAKVIYKNMTYGGKIAMAYQAQGNQIRLSGKDGNNDFVMTLSSGEDNRLLGTATDGSKTMTVRLMPTTESFEVEGRNQTKTSNPYDVSTIVSAFISKYSNGFAPWNCLNATSVKRLSNNLEEDRTAGGIYMVPFTAPLTIKGKGLATNQLDETIDWDIYLRGPNAGATNIMFSAMPQYVDLKDVAKNFANSIGASYLRRRDFDYGQDVVYLYSLNDMRLAIYCSFGAHGGTIEAVLGNPEVVNEYANNCM